MARSPYPHFTPPEVPPLIQLIVAATLHANESPIASVPNHPASGLLIRLPMKTRTANDASGSSVARVSNSAGVGMALSIVRRQWSVVSCKKQLTTDHGPLTSSPQIRRPFHIDRC